MKLAACARCHAQYDVTGMSPGTFACRCGEEVRVEDRPAVDAAILRCGSCGAILAHEATDCGYCGSAVYKPDGTPGLICPECFARNTEDCRFCTACGVAFAPEPVPFDAPELPCPCCGCLMSGRPLYGITLHECPTCRGTWVPDDGFEALVRRALAASRSGESMAVAPRVAGAQPSTRVEYRKCPVCDALMNRRNFRKRSGVIIDVCRVHGTWLDADELEQIAGFIRSGGMAVADAEERARFEERRRREAARAVYTSASYTPRSRASERPVLESVVELFFRLLT